MIFPAQLLSQVDIQQKKSGYIAISRGPNRFERRKTEAELRQQLRERASLTEKQYRHKKRLDKIAEASRRQQRRRIH